MKTIIYPFVFFCFIAGSTAEPVQMRIVKDTASYGFSSLPAENILIPSTLASNFSGPKLLKRLHGKCFNFTQNQYLYSFCPFQNFTQYELSSRWNAYRGILGVWSHWNIENGTFKSMIYKHGDSCGNVARSIEVSLNCGQSEALLNVTEPKKCSYSAIFTSKYLCHNESLLVYPRLSTDLQKQWDELFTEYHLGYLTNKGYNLKLEKIFIEAGLVASSSKEEPDVSTVSTTPKDSFGDLASCNKAYLDIAKEVMRLNQEIDHWKLLLDLSKAKEKT